LLDDPALRSAVALWLAKHENSETYNVAAFSSEPALNRAFHKAQAPLKLPVKYNASSIRSGAATAAFLRGLDPLTIRLHGRWESEKTLRHYVQAGAAVLQAHRLEHSLAFQRTRILAARHPTAVLAALKRQG
jgi:hypothetical protein